jgi:hypothetical protein
MTEQEIDEMPAGPAMDALVAKLVMGWKGVIDFGQGEVTGKNPEGRPMFARVPAFSTSIADAFDVLNKLLNDRPGTDEWAITGLHPASGDAAVITFRMDDFWGDDTPLWGEGENVQEAICRAALRSAMERRT